MNLDLRFQKDLEEVARKFSKDLKDNSVIVFSGSIPKNVNKDIYKLWIEKIQS